MHADRRRKEGGRDPPRGANSNEAHVQPLNRGKTANLHSLGAVLGTTRGWGWLHGDWLTSSGGGKPRSTTETARKSGRIC